MTAPTAPDGTPASRLCFGAMQFGGTADEAASAALFDAARAAGVTWFDTAHVYTGGASERILGRLAGAERDALVIATKAPYDAPPTAARIRAAADESRARLGTDVIDLLYLHRWSDAVELEESIGALADLRERGVVRAIGVSNFAAWQVMKAQAVARALGTRIDAIQPMLNLVKRQAEVEILPMAADQGIAVAAYSPLGGGLLTGKYARGGTGRLTEVEMYRRRYDDDRIRAGAAGLADLAAETGHDPATLAVAWVLAKPGVHPIVSARSAAQLAPSLAAADLVLDGNLAARLDALMPAPPPATDRTEEG